MENQKAFVIYASFLVAATVTVVTAVVLASGKSFPPAFFIAEHAAMSLLFRSAYKSFDGTNWFARLMDMTGLTGGVEVEAEASAPGHAVGSAA